MESGLVHLGSRLARLGSGLEKGVRLGSRLGSGLLLLDIIDPHVFCDEVLEVRITVS